MPQQRRSGLTDHVRMSAFVIVLVAAFAMAPPAHATVLYDTSVAGSQTVTWSFSGDLKIGACGSGAGDTPVLQTGTGSGAMSFAFRSVKPGLAVPSSFGAFSFSFDASAKATGKLMGAMTLTNGRTCAGFTPPVDLTAASSSCGPQVFGLQLQGQWKNGFVYITGADDAAFAGAAPDAGQYATCPYPFTLPSFSRATGPTTACENARSVPLWRRTSELSTFGRGLGSVRLAASPKSLARPAKRVTTLSRRVIKRCVIPLNNSTSPLNITVTTQVNVTLKRRG